MLVNLDDVFYFHISQYLDDNCDPTTVAEARSRSDWSMWEEAMRSELGSLNYGRCLVQLRLRQEGLTQWVVNECL